MLAVRTELETFKLTNPCGYPSLSISYAHSLKGRGSFPHVIPRTIVCPCVGGNKAPTAVVDYGSMSNSLINIAQRMRTSQELTGLIDQWNSDIRCNQIRTETTPGWVGKHVHYDVAASASAWGRTGLAYHVLVVGGTKDDSEVIVSTWFKIRQRSLLVNYQSCVPILLATPPFDGVLPAPHWP